MDEQPKQERKQAIVIAAAIFAARSLADWDGHRSPRAIAAAADAIEKAQFLVDAIERKLQ
jgi:pantothenate synthetase